VERDRVIGYLAAMTDDEYAAVQAEARGHPAAPAPIKPGDTASVRRSIAAAARAMWETPRDHNGPTAAGSFASAVAARQPEPHPQPTVDTPRFQPPPDTGYTGSDSLRRTPFVTPVTTTTTHIR
jgi:hypothetical protein